MNTLNERLKSAVQSTPVPPYLEARIRNRIRTAAEPRSWTLRLIPAAIAAGLLITVGTAYQLGHLRRTRASQESYITSVSSQISSLMRVGFGDHLHCSFFRKYPKNAPTAAELVTKIGPKYAELVPVVRKHVPEQYKMTIAHECHYRNRGFIHLSLKDDSNMLSLVITRKNQGESFAVEQMLPALVQSGIPMYQNSAQRFTMTAFETGDFLVYFVSDLPQNVNTQMMLAMTPEVKEILTKLAS